MNIVKDRRQSIMRIGEPFGDIPENIRQHMKGDAQFADIGSALMGVDMGLRLLVNIEAVNLMSGDATSHTGEQMMSELRKSILRVLKGLIGVPCGAMVIMEASREWFGRPVLVHHHLDCEQPFIAIAA